MKLIRERRAIWVHLAPPRRSFPIERRPTHKLRSRRFPHGLPHRERHPLVIKGNEHARVTVKLAKAVVRSGGFYSIAHPRSSLLWRLPAVMSLARNPGSFFVHMDQCTLGARSKKPTSWLTNAPHMRDIELTCPGVTEHHVHEELDGQEHAPYPETLCKKLAAAYRAYANQPFIEVAPVKFKRNAVEDPTFPENERKHLRKRAEAEAIGGQRLASSSLVHLPLLRDVGAKLGRCLDEVVASHRQKMHDVIKQLGTDDATDIPDEVLDDAADIVGKTFGKGSGADLLERIMAETLDPDVDIPVWLRSYTPLGIKRAIRPRGIFPIMTDVERARQSRGYPKPFPEMAKFFNYNAFSENERLAMAEFKKEIAEGFVEASTDRGELEERYGRIVLSRIAAIVKTTNDKVKTRVGARSFAERGQPAGLAGGTRSAAPSRRRAGPHRAAHGERRSQRPSRPYGVGL